MVKAGSIREYAYTPGSNLLVRHGRHAVVHDLAGHQTGARSGRSSFAYNQAGRVDAYFKNGELKATYVYDHLGRRAYKVKAGNHVVYHYDKNGHLIGESDGSSGKPIKDYVWAGDQPVLYAKVKRTNAGLLKEKLRIYLVTDHLNTPRLGLDENRTIVWRWDGEPFGLSRPDRDPDGDGKKVTINLRFPGQYYDSESGLHYNWNRYYDPKTGRYITSDPIGLDGGLNTYSYVSSNPLVRIDPYGTVEWTGTQIEVGAAFGVGASFTRLELSTKCIGEKQGRATVWAVGPSIGIGAGFDSSVSGSPSVKFEDNLSTPSPQVFNGIYSGYYVGVGYGPGKLGLQITVLGRAHAVGPTLGYGFGISAGYIYTVGTSTVVDSSLTNCCE